MSAGKWHKSGAPQCPFRVKLRLQSAGAACPFYPQEQTFLRPAALRKQPFKWAGVYGLAFRPSSIGARSPFDLIGSPLRGISLLGHRLPQRERALPETFILQYPGNSRPNAPDFGVGTQPDSRTAGGHAGRIVMLITDQRHTNHRHAMPQRLCQCADTSLSYESVHMGQNQVMRDEFLQPYICWRLELLGLERRPERDQSADGHI
jgi:hypothetical protein